ncbi:uncharacterized protein isoform X3 [Rhodnius prolixus]|uniref:uncharacterized protein isoform X3 n=1 Tax=Rhodnius prolixus TaxID=13249 RepID=UPI003D18A62F
MSLFSDLRNLMGTTLMTLLATTFMAQLIYVVGVGGVHDRELCLSISFSLQYLHLSLILWMGLLCRDTLISVQRGCEDGPRTDRLWCRFAVSSLISWSLPGLAVLAAYGATDTSHLQPMYKVNCWFVCRPVYLLTYGFPAMVVLCTCVCLLIRAKIRLTYMLSLETRQKLRSRAAKSKGLEVGLCSRLTCLLFSLELSAVLYAATGAKPFWLIYNLLHSIQGLIMALCATCNSQVLSVYTRRHRRRRSTTKLLSKTSSLEDLDWTPLPSTI